MVIRFNCKVSSRILFDINSILDSRFSVVDSPVSILAVYSSYLFQILILDDRIIEIYILPLNIFENFFSFLPLS